MHYGDESEFRAATQAEVDKIFLFDFLTTGDRSEGKTGRDRF